MNMENTLMRKKIGIINHWMVNNYGALFLAYGLESKLLEMGYDVETIRWLPDEVRRPWKLSYVKKTGVVHYILRLGYFAVFILPRQFRFREFRKRIHAGHKEYSDKTLHEIADDYGIIIIGGDQLWNTKRHYYNRNNFLPFIKEPERKKVYAASISQEYIRNDIKEQFKNDIESFSFITARENTTKRLIEEISDVNVRRITDPAFLLSKEEWIKLKKKPDVSGKYIFVYQVQSDRLVIDYAEMYAKKYNCKVVYCPFPLKKQIKCHRRPYASPEEWLGYIANAEYVVTDAFHGLVFSLIFNKQFVVEISEYGKDTGSRIRDLLDVYGLSDRLLTEESKERLITSGKIDFERINEIIRSEQKEADRMIKEMTNYSSGGGRA